MISDPLASLGMSFAFLMLAVIKLEDQPSRQSDAERTYPEMGTDSAPWSRCPLHAFRILVTVPFPKVQSVLKLEEASDIISSKLDTTHALGWLASPVLKRHQEPRCPWGQDSRAFHKNTGRAGAAPMLSLTAQVLNDQSTQA